MRMCPLLGGTAGAVSPCRYLANYTSRDDTLHEGHRTGHGPSSKSPAPAQAGTLAASCVLPVSFPVCKGRSYHLMLKSRLHSPPQLINVQLPRHASHGGAAVDVEVNPVSVFSSFLSCPPVLVGLGQGQSGGNSPGFATASSCLHAFISFY